MPISSSLGRDPDPEHHVDDLDDDERRDRGVRDRGADGDELVDELLGVALEQPGERRLDGGSGEDAGRDRAEHAADAVDREHVERVIDLQARAQQRGAVAQAADDEADDSAPPTPTKPDAGVIATRPATAPQAAPMTLTLPLCR